MIDCRSLDAWEETAQKKKTETSAVAVCNSNVSHKEVPAILVAAKKAAIVVEKAWPSSSWLFLQC
eukprot:1322944-Ditylum_brightwellii.AAC.1